MSHLNFSHFVPFPPIFCLLKMTCLVTLFDRKLQVFQKLAKINHFRHFQWTFVHSKCKSSSLRFNIKWDIFLWFSNSVCFKMNESRSACLVCKNFPLRLWTGVLRKYKRARDDYWHDRLRPPCVGAGQGARQDQLQSHR